MSASASGVPFGMFGYVDVGHLAVAIASGSRAAGAFSPRWVRIHNTARPRRRPPISARDDTKRAGIAARTKHRRPRDRVSSGRAGAMAPIMHPRAAKRRGTTRETSRWTSTPTSN